MDSENIKNQAGESKQENPDSKTAVDKVLQLERKLKFTQNAFAGLDELESTLKTYFGENDTNSAEEFLKKYLEKE